MNYKIVDTLFVLLIASILFFSFEVFAKTSNTKLPIVKLNTKNTIPLIGPINRELYEKIKKENLTKKYLYIDSGGGETSYGMKIYELLKNKKRTIIVKRGYSMAAMISQMLPGTVYVTSNSEFMLHPISMKINGSLDEVDLYFLLKSISHESSLIYDKIERNRKLNSGFLQSIFRQNLFVNKRNRPRLYKMFYDKEINLLCSKRFTKEITTCHNQR